MKELNDMTQDEKLDMILKHLYGIGCRVTEISKKINGGKIK